MLMLETRRASNLVRMYKVCTKNSIGKECRVTSVDLSRLENVSLVFSVMGKLTL